MMSRKCAALNLYEAFRETGKISTLCRERTRGKKISRPGWLFGKAVLMLLAWHVFLICNPAHVMGEDSVEPGNLSDARRLDLKANMSFVLESYEKVARVAVGRPEIADVRALNGKEILINALRVGTTNLIVWHRDNTTQVYHITVKYDTSEIKKKLKELVPGAQIDLSTSFGMLMVSGSVDGQETMDRVLTVLRAFAGQEYIKNLMTLKGYQQVQLEAKIVEVSRSDLKRYGLSLLINGSSIGGGLLTPGSAGDNFKMNLDGVSAEPGSVTTSYNNNTGVTTTTISQGEPSHFDMVSDLTLESPFTNAFQVAFHLLDDDIAGILSLLKGQGLATSLARPTLVAMSGQEASFHVGGSFPVPVTGSYGTTGFNNQEYGVVLEFLPLVTGKETIHLTVTTSVSDIDYSTSITSGGATVPGIVSREASSTLVLKDGQTFVIAGLLKENNSSTVNKVPLLGDLPIVGAAFRTKEYIKQETELIILVTPRLVKAMNKEDIPPLPGEMEEFDQNDLEFFFLDRIWKPKQPVSDNKPRFSGPMGFEN